VQQALRPALFSGLLLLAAYLRITGLAWGLNSGYGHDRNFQPDEFVSLRGVLQLDLLNGRIKAPGAYFEGTFNYYLWALPQAVLKSLGAKDAHPSDSSTTTDPSVLLYICRWMSVVFDLGAILFVFLAIREATQNFYPSLVGALCYAVLPMQIIYAHFMRTHILSNLLCALVIWLSLKLRKSRRWELLLLVGLISGLGAATRYPVGMIVVIPCLYLLFDGGSNLTNSKVRLAERAKDFISSQVWLIGLGVGIGLFLGHPMLFLDTSRVMKAIIAGTLKYASLHEFSPSQFANLSVVWSYVTYLIPFGMYPFLWLLPYCAIVYILCRPNLYRVSSPILIFSILYLYVMGKGYLGPYFARITMLLFPGFCVLVGIALADITPRLRAQRILTGVSVCALLFVIGPSVVFDMAYSRAMQQKDVRQLVREDLQTFIGSTSATIGVSRFEHYFYTAMPAAKPLSSENVTVRLQDPWQDADFFLVGFLSQIDSAEMNETIKDVEARGKFKYNKSYYVPVKILGYEFSLVRFPPDMTYPFPTILLFRAKTAI
jgi:Dolichyl-phosphate-mannose-protein mannosyltransferase